MNREESQAKFQQADEMYRAGHYYSALELLVELDEHYPNNRRLLFARAKTLAKLRRDEEALELCRRLIEEFGYAKALHLRDRLELRAAPPQSFPFDEVEHAQEVPETESSPGTKRFRIKPIRLLILLGLLAGMYMGTLPYWLGGGLIIAYFAFKWAFGKLLYNLFQIPFKMKGKALAGATAEVHAVSPAPVPVRSNNDDDEDEEPKKKDLRFVYIDVTISPAHRTKGFIHWEPGELALAPAKLPIRSLDDLEHCFHVNDVIVVGAAPFDAPRTDDDDEDEDDAGSKFIGPKRVKLHVGVPKNEQAFKFVYYTEAFGAIHVPTNGQR